MKNIVIDTSALLAVILNEPERNAIINLTKGTDLIAPSSLHWEVGNAFSALFKKHGISLKNSLAAIEVYRRIPIQFEDINLSDALKIADKLKICAYDAYMIACAHRFKLPLLTLDKKLYKLACQFGVEALEV